MNKIGDPPGKKPLISVIIPVFDVEDYVRETLDSVQNQSYKNAEFIVINDGSTDSSGEIIDQYPLKDDRFRIYHQENKGLSATRNRGLGEARGDIIYFLDSDDVLAEGAFKTIVQQINQTDSQVVLFSYAFIDEYGAPYKSSTPKSVFVQREPITGSECIQKLMKTGNYGCSVSRFFFQKIFLLENNLQFDEQYLHEDEAFTIEVYCLSDRVTCLPDPFLKRRFRPNSIITSKKGEINVKGWAKAIERVLDFINKNDIDEKTREAVLTRLRSIAHTAIRTLKNIEHPKKPVEHYLPNQTQNNLGFLVKAHAKSTFLYRVLKFINRKIW